MAKFVNVGNGRLLNLEMAKSIEFCYVNDYAYSGNIPKSLKDYYASPEIIGRHKSATILTHNHTYSTSNVEAVAESLGVDLDAIFKEIDDKEIADAEKIAAKDAITPSRVDGEWVYGVGASTTGYVTIPQASPQYRNATTLSTMRPQRRHVTIDELD